MGIAVLATEVNEDFKGTLEDKDEETISLFRSVVPVGPENSVNTYVTVEVPASSAGVEITEQSVHPTKSGFTCC